MFQRPESALEPCMALPHMSLGVFWIPFLAETQIQIKTAENCSDEVLKRKAET